MCRRHYPVVTPATVDGDCLRETALLPPSPLPPLLVLASSLGEFSSPLSRPRFLRGFRTIRLSRVVCNLHSFLSPATLRAERCLLSFSSSFARARVYLSFPIRTRYISPVSSLHPAIPPLGTTGSTFPSSRRDSVSVSSIFPLSRCPERLNTNAFIAGTTTDVRRVTSPAWAHPRTKERERRMTSFSHLSFQACPLFSHLSPSFSLPLYPREFHSSGFCGPSLSPLSLSFLTFARACRKTRQIDR